tara:strand:+ start:679 stop:1155 length:477 start_codon:yes stop_codon:yes gene_type:complete
MDIENKIIYNLKKYYMDANNKRIHIDDIYKEEITINPKRMNSICLWNANMSVIRIKKKCNHLLIYNCKNITIHTDNYISGITCIGCFDCNILFYNDMFTGIEMSRSFNINIRSNMFDSNILYNGVNTNFVKHNNYILIGYVNVNDGLLSEWKIKKINI